MHPLRSVFHSHISVRKLLQTTQLSLWARYLLNSLAATGVLSPCREASLYRTVAGRALCQLVGSTEDLAEHAAVCFSFSPSAASRAASPAPASSSRRCGLVLNYSVTEQQDGTNQLKQTQIVVQRCVTILASGSMWAREILCASHMRLLHIAILLQWLVILSSSSGNTAMLKMRKKNT